jgi:hypothetical protein
MLLTTSGTNFYLEFIVRHAIILSKLTGFTSSNVSPKVCFWGFFYFCYQHSIKGEKEKKWQKGKKIASFPENAYFQGDAVRVFVNFAQKVILRNGFLFKVNRNTWLCAI